MIDPGVHPWQVWQQHGVSRAALRRGLQNGQYSLVRPGWYAAAGAHPLAVEAVAKHGAVSCLSVLGDHGVWIPPHSGRLHLRGSIPAHREYPGRFCRQFGRPQPVRVAIDDAFTALRHALRCLDHEGITVTCDSLLNISRRYGAGEGVAEILTPSDIRSAFDSAPAHVLACLHRCDGRAESGTGTMVRLRLQRKNVKVHVQQHIPGLGRVDLLAGDRLAIEIDSKAHHTGAERYREDRRRDLVATSLGIRSMRLTYENVVYQWPATEAAIMSVIRSGYHRAPRRRP